MSPLAECVLSECKRLSLPLLPTSKLVIYHLWPREFGAVHISGGWGRGEGLKMKEIHRGRLTLRFNVM